MSRLGAVGALLILGACSTDGSTAPQGPGVGPAVLTRSVTQVSVVGEPFRYDATLGGAAFIDPRGGGLTYSTLLTPTGSGLSTDGGMVTGTPSEPAVVLVELTATDEGGRQATQAFRIVIFASKLPLPRLPATPYRYSDESAPVPDYFWRGTTASLAGIDNTPADNHTTDPGAALGRVLFYDTRLSRDDRVACASCHLQVFGFSDTARFSLGVGGGRTARHTMALGNNRFYQNGRYFWDERAPSLEVQVLQPIQDPLEMAMRLEDLVVKLGVTPYYVGLFRSAFGTPEVTTDRIARALAQFVRSLLSTQSRLDSAFLGGGPPDFSRLTAQEQEGHDLFVGPGGCAACHHTNTQVNDAARNTGLDAVDLDAGAGAGRFKAPSLRNVAVHPPYMHDGRFRTLRQVVDFYDSGVLPSAGLDTRLRTQDGTPKRLNLTSANLDALVAFLETLTDPAFLSAPRFSNPFSSP